MTDVLNNRTDRDLVLPGPWVRKPIRQADVPEAGPGDIVPASTHEEGTALVAAATTRLVWSGGGYRPSELLNALRPEAADPRLY